MKAWLFDEQFQFDRHHLYVEGIQGEWGAGDSIAEEEELPPSPQNVQAKPGNGRIIITWDPVPEAMYYNLYFQTTKGVQINPREELVRRLLEYKTYKEAATRLDGQEKMWREIFSREQAPAEPVEADETLLENVSLFDLVDALQGIMNRNPGKKLIEIMPDNLTVRERMNVILELLEGKDSVSFVDLFEQTSHRLVVIVTFLAMLELIRLRVARVFQAEAFGPILVSRAFSLVPDPAELGDVDVEWRGT
ncbi:MAG: segregation/condensation protein A [Nitrospira sp.]|nr:segregation/condensation protein A [Nitrospira sp.]